MKLKKLLFILFFILFFGLFFNLNECFAVDDIFTQAMYDYCYSKYEMPIFYTYNNSDVYVATYGRLGPNGPSKFNSFDVHGILYGYYGGDHRLRLLYNYNDRGTSPIGDIKVYHFNNGTFKNYSAGADPMNAVFVNYRNNVVNLTDDDFVFENSYTGEVLHDFFPVPPPPIPEKDIFKVHIKDLNCGIWRNFSFWYPNYNNEKYAIFLDSFERDTENCNNSSKLKLKMYVLECDEHWFLDNHSVEKPILEDSGGYFLYLDYDNREVHVPFRSKYYSVFETTLNYEDNSEFFNLALADFKFLGVTDTVRSEKDNLYDLWGQCLGSASNFIGSNVDVYTLYKEDYVKTVKNIASSVFPDFNIVKIFSKIVNVATTAGNYCYLKSYNHLDTYATNATLSNISGSFKNEFWVNIDNGHQHIETADGTPEKDVYLNNFYVVSGSRDYPSVDNSDNILSLEDDKIREFVYEYFEVLQTTTNTDTYVVKDETTGENKVNNDKITDTDKDIVNSSSSDSNGDRDGWGVLDFLGGILDKIIDFFSVIKKILFSLLDFLFNFFDKLVALFVPSSDFWSDFSSDLTTDLEGSLGLLFQPFELLGGLLERYNNIEFGEPKLVIPAFTLPIWDIPVWEEREINFNSFVENEVLHGLHEIYLVAVDAYLIFILLNKIIEIEEEFFEK